MNYQWYEIVLIVFLSYWLGLISGIIAKRLIDGKNDTLL